MTAARITLALLGVGLLVGLGASDRAGPLGLPAVLRFGARPDYHYVAVALFGVALLALAALWPKVKAAAEAADGRLQYSEAGRRIGLQLFIASALGLFLEIMLIRWLSVEVRIFAYFKNLALLGGFFGLGLGALRHARPIRLSLTLTPLAALVLLVHTSFLFPGASVPDISYSLGATMDIMAGSAGSGGLTVAQHALGLLLLGVLLALLTVVFYPLGQVVGRTIETAGSPIRAYSINVAGSLAGVALFAALSFSGLPPVVWFGVALVLLAPLLPRTRASGLIAGALALVLLAAVVGARPAPKVMGRMWSPYHKLTWSPLVLPWEGKQRTLGHTVRINNATFQRPVNLRPEHLAGLPKVDLEHLPYNRYNLAYRLKPSPPDVLIIGAGTGNDVAAAIRGGAGAVTAVEIDPALVELGRRIHAERPYADPRVEVVINDARAFMNKTSKRFDLIVFATLDSHTLANGFTNIQLDHYIYTLESMRAARRLLKPEGVLYMPYAVSRPWLIGRFEKMLTRAFDQPPKVLYTKKAVFWQWGRWVFVAGAQAPLAEAARRDPKVAELLDPEQVPSYEQVGPDHPIPTDDWPYLYLEGRSIPSLYFEISALLLVVFFLLGRASGGLPGRFNGHFFWLGAAFLLLEFQALSRLALIFGATWIVSSVVISGILVMILLANFAVSRLRPKGLAAPFALLGASLLGSFLLPNAWLTGSPAHTAAATVITLLPLAFAGVVFATSFSAVEDRAGALGINLVGAVVGGLLESVSFVIGIPSVVVLAALLYGAAFLARPRAAAAAEGTPAPAA